MLTAGKAGFQPAPTRAIIVIGATDYLATRQQIASMACTSWLTTDGSRLDDAADAEGDLGAEADRRVVQIKAGDFGDAVQAVAERVAMQDQGFGRLAVVAAVGQEGVQRLQQLGVRAGAAVGVAIRR